MARVSANCTTLLQVSSRLHLLSQRPNNLHPRRCSSSLLSSYLPAQPPSDSYLPPRLSQTAPFVLSLHSQPSRLSRGDYVPFLLESIASRIKWHLWTSELPRKRVGQRPFIIANSSQQGAFLTLFEWWDMKTADARSDRKGTSNGNAPFKGEEWAEAGFTPFDTKCPAFPKHTPTYVVTVPWTWGVSTAESDLGLFTGFTGLRVNLWKAISGHSVLLCEECIGGKNMLRFFQKGFAAWKTSPLPALAFYKCPCVCMFWLQLLSELCSRNESSEHRKLSMLTVHSWAGSKRKLHGQPAGWQLHSS